MRNLVAVLAVVAIALSMVTSPPSAHAAPREPRQVRKDAARKKPNILLLVSDDQGYRDLGCFGSEEVRTPSLDRLAEGGVRLTSFYVTWPACTPSRGSLLTGRYPQRHGVYDMIRNEAPDYGKKYTPAEYAVTFERIGGMDTREVLLPRMLGAGYTSGIFGKWDLGISRRFLPPARGFDRFYGFVNTGIDYFTHERYGVPSMFRDNQPTTEDRGTYCTYLFQREAVRFLKEHHERPFFLYVPFNAPHSASNLDAKIRGAAQAPEKYKAEYRQRLGWRENYVKTTRYGKPAMTPDRQTRRLEYAASITCMDDGIGELLGLLDRYGIAEDTIVIFFSDNGGGGGSDNGPLRGGKGQMFEGGLRVPCIVRYPRKIAAGTTSDAFLTSLEIVPTLLKATGTPPPEGVVLDGYDMMPVLAGSAASPRDATFWQRRDHLAARVAHWKWVQTPSGGGLFDLSKDIGETTDLSRQQPARVEELKARFTAWRKAMDTAEPRGPFRDY